MLATLILALVLLFDNTFGHADFECPHWLGAICDPVCIMQHCGPVMKNCMRQPVSRASSVSSSSRVR